MKTYITKLKREQINLVCKLAKDGMFVPLIAKRFDMTISETLSMLRSEMCHQYIKFEKYGSKRYNFKDPVVKENLKRLIDAGHNDDEIAALWETSYFAIARGRSTAGLVKFHRIVEKGHRSKHEFSHLDKKFGDKGSQLSLDLDLDQQDKDIAVMFQQTPDGIIVPNHRQKKELTICFDANDNVPSEIKQAISSKINWRSIVMRLQNPNNYYSYKDKDRTYYYKQVNVDAYNQLVSLELVMSLSSAKTAT